MHANWDEATTLEEAAEIYQRHRARGFHVIPFDERNREYWMDDDGQLKLTP
jgi:hypothetical protein